MFPQFFANKPVERLIGPGLCADDLNDDVLGRCLDALFAADVSTLYQVMAEQVVAKLGLKPTAVHLDITSFHVDGAYDAPMANRPAGCNWCGDTAVTIGQSSIR